MQAKAHLFLVYTSNDPDVPVYNISLDALAVAELSGDLCANLSYENSPYTLINDVYIHDSCNVIIEAACEN